MGASRQLTATRPRTESLPNEARFLRVWDHRDFGLMAKARRMALELRQHEVAERACVSRQWLSDFEHGKATLEIGLAFRVFTALEIDLLVPVELPPPGWAKELSQTRERARIKASYISRNMRRRVLRKTKKARVHLLALIKARGRP